MDANSTQIDSDYMLALVAKLTRTFKPVNFALASVVTCTYILVLVMTGVVMKNTHGLAFERVFFVSILTCGLFISIVNFGSLIFQVAVEEDNSFKSKSTYALTNMLDSLWVMALIADMYSRCAASVVQFIAYKFPRKIVTWLQPRNMVAVVATVWTMSLFIGCVNYAAIQKNEWNFDMNLDGNSSQALSHDYSVKGREKLWQPVIVLSLFATCCPILLVFNGLIIRQVCVWNLSWLRNYCPDKNPPRAVTTALLHFVAFAIYCLASVIRVLMSADIKAVSEFLEKHPDRMLIIDEITRTVIIFMPLTVLGIYSWKLGSFKRRLVTHHHGIILHNKTNYMPMSGELDRKELLAI